MARKTRAPKQPDIEHLTIEQALSRAAGHWKAGQAEQAKQLCRSILDVWPGQPDALHLLGLIAHAFGDLDLALQHLRGACQLPRTPAAYLSNLAELCRQKGLLDEAEQAARRATALDGNFHSAWNNLGIILQEMGRLEESVLCLERVVALQPDIPQIYNNLANTYQRLGQLDKAKLCYEKAFALYPDYAEAHSNLANLLKDLGQFDPAAHQARLAIEINPQLPDAYINLAAIEVARKRYDDALRWLEALLQFAPKHVRALIARARTLRRCDRLNEALEMAMRAVDAAPALSDSHNTLGEILQAAGRLDEALASFERAMALPGTEVEAAGVNRATLLLTMGAKPAAREAFDALLKRHPRNVPVMVARADILNDALGEPDIAEMEGLLSPGGVQNLDDRIGLHFILGQAYLARAESDRAFAHLAAGNRLKRATYAFDHDAASRWMRGITDVFSASLMKKFAGAGVPSGMPIFIIGMPRSGTSLIEQILASHAQIHGAGELSVMERLVQQLNPYPARIESLTAGDFATLGARYVADIAALSAGKRHVVDKMPVNFLHAGLIHLMLPNARIIHCRRDPIDTCLSCYVKLFSTEQVFAYDLVELGRFHKDYRSMMAHWAGLIPADRFIEVDYEAVVEDLDGQTRRLLAFLGLPWDPACLDFHKTVRPVATASVNQVRQPIYRSARGRWRAHARHLAPLIEALEV